MTRKLLLLSLLALGLTLTAVGYVAAQPASRPVAQASPLHPTFALLDESGQNVLAANGAVSTMKTCGQCHDTAFIAGHSFHADLGLSDFGASTSGRAWDTSPGLFGKWNPLTYRYLSVNGDERLDLGAADWIKLMADRLAGGGPATTSRSGVPLENLPARADDVETSVLAPATGQPVIWDWTQSGTVEMNCFLCHLANPNNAERITAIQAGDFQWDSTATLVGTGLVRPVGDTWQWNPIAFDSNGELVKSVLPIQDPTNENCGQCHGVVHMEATTPLVITQPGLADWQTATTGQVIAPEKISESGLNLADKDQLARAWDIHAERGLKCTDCHYALNNPAQYQEPAASRPDYLTFDPRRLEIGEYLQKPLHQFARGQSAQYTVAPELKATMRRCEACHNASTTHTWLPYVERHLSAVACETCHIPKLYAPAVQAFDWTVLTTQSEPRQLYRGVEGNTGTLADLVTGYEPVLLPRQNVDGQTLLAPYNLISAWYWVYDDTRGNTRPVRLVDLQAAWLPNGQYAPEVLKALDANGNGLLEDSELKLDTPAKTALVAGRLSALGLQNPRIVGEVQPYSVNHNVTAGEYAIKDCQVCHSANSRITQAMPLSPDLPGGVKPEFVKDVNTQISGQLESDGGALLYRPATTAQALYVFGHDRVAWVDWIGALALVGVLVGVTTHGGLRAYAALRSPRPKPGLQRVYMYAVYERFWHWLQTFTIVLLLFTGLIIHRPDLFGLFSFPGVVVAHNVLAAILVVNAALSLFYHLASGEIRQFIPRPYGFFDQAIVQAKYYLGGIFRRDPHPFEKTPQKKLNPLQQMTYFGILNVLLPLQIITGALMWGVQQWPQIVGDPLQGTGWLGGLPFLAPVHSLAAWLFAAFIVAHVYLTTTSHEPLASVKAMMLGWDEVEDHSLPPVSTLEEVPYYDHTDPIQTPAP